MQKNKYHAIKTALDGIVFHSKKEASRYAELRLLEKAGRISNLILQPKFEIVPKVGSLRARHYIADFRYLENGVQVVEDVKGYKTAIFKLKKQLFLSRYGDQVRFLET